MNRWLITGLGIGLLLLGGCAGDQPTRPPDVLPDDAFTTALAAAGMVVPLGPEQDEVTTTSEESGGFRYTYETHDVVENLENIAYLGMNDDVIWPGNLVRGDQADSYVYEPITARRAPITLSISLESSSIGGELSEVVAAPSLSRVRQGINDLVDRVFVEDTHVPAQVDFSYQQVHSASQMSLFVGADLGYCGGSLSTTFNWDEQSTATRIMARYTQVYYSIDIDTPPSPRALFADDLTATELAATLPAGSCPLYVAGVKYGMMAIMCIETQFTSSQMQLALDFGYTAAEVLQQSSIRIMVYGGSTGGIGELNGFDAFMDIIGASTQFTAESPGVPLLYKFRHVRDNTLALISLTSQYTVVRPLRIEQRVRVTTSQFLCTWSHDDDPFYDGDVDVDRLWVWCNAFQRADAADPGEQINPVDQAVFSWGTSD